MIFLGFLSVIALALFCIFAFFFLFIIAFGAPYVPTLKAQRDQALDLLDLKKGQTLLELGSGDGSLLIDAAERGLKVVGYEFNLILVLISRWRARRVKDRVKIIWGNFWKADLSQADGIFVFQMDYSMKRLEAKILAEKKGKVKLASHAFKISGRKPAAKSGSVILYEF
jgi:SAM-dependent methyltransferase